MSQVCCGGKLEEGVLYVSPWVLEGKMVYKCNKINQFLGEKGVGLSYPFTKIMWATPFLS